ncbi:hypothetical protein PO909_016121 [Leuciscus waleckii]
MMPTVEQPLATYLAPESASSLKTPVLPTKPCRDTSSLVGRAYMAAGRAGASLHTMAALQAYQADLLKDIDESPTPEDIADIKDIVEEDCRLVSQSHQRNGPCYRPFHGGNGGVVKLWLNLSGIKEKDRAFLLEAPISPSGLFGDSVNIVVDRPGLNNSKIKHLEDLPGRPNDPCGVLQGPVGNPPKYETPTSPTNPLFVRLPTIVDKCPVDPTAGLKPRPRPTNPLFVRLPIVVAKCPVD